MTLKLNDITTATDIAELVGSAQGAYAQLEVDWETGEIEIVGYHESQRNSHSARQHHGHESTWILPAVDALDIRSAVEGCIPVIQAAQAQYYSRWDGSNHVAGWRDLDAAREADDYPGDAEIYDTAYQRACTTIERALDEMNGTPCGYMDPATWFDHGHGDPDDLKATTTDEEIATIAAREAEDVDDPHTLLDADDVELYLRERRDEMMPDAWEAAVEAGATVYRVMECDGHEEVEGVAENRGGAQVVQLGDRWLYVDDVDAYSLISGETIALWQSGRCSTTLESTATPVQLYAIENASGQWWTGECWGVRENRQTYTAEELPEIDGLVLIDAGDPPDWLYCDSDLDPSHDAVAGLRPE